MGLDLALQQALSSALGMGNPAVALPLDHTDSLFGGDGAMPILNFLDSLKGVRLVFFIGLTIAFQYVYLYNVQVANIGLSSTLASTAMALITAGATIKIAIKVIDKLAGYK